MAGGRSGAGLFLAAVLLGGCEQIQGMTGARPIAAETLDGQRRERRVAGEEVRVWHDPGNGCQYLLWDGRRRGGMTPRLGPDGRPICRGR